MRVLDTSHGLTRAFLCKSVPEFLVVSVAACHESRAKRLPGPLLERNVTRAESPFNFPMLSNAEVRVPWLIADI